MYDVLILGAGAAGISASIYCASRGMKTCVIEKDEIGGVPNTHIFKDCEMQSDFIKTDECMSTNIEGVYAAGDIRHKQVKQVSTAVSDGTIAGINAFLYLNKKTNA